MITKFFTIATMAAVAIALTATAAPVENNPTAMPTCCEKNAYCCRIREACCPKGPAVIKAVATVTEGKAAPTCCEKNAYCCRIREACCPRAAAL